MGLPKLISSVLLLMFCVSCNENYHLNLDGATATDAKLSLPFSVLGETSIVGSCFPDGSTVTVSSEDFDASNPGPVSCPCVAGRFDCGIVRISGTGPNGSKPKFKVEVEDPNGNTNAGEQTVPVPAVDLVHQVDIEVGEATTLTGACNIEGATVELSSADMSPASASCTCANEVFSCGPVTFSGTGPNGAMPVVVTTMTDPNTAIVVTDQDTLNINLFVELNTSFTFTPSSTLQVLPSNMGSCAPSGADVSLAATPAASMVTSPAACSCNAGVIDCSSVSVVINSADFTLTPNVSNGGSSLAGSASPVDVPAAISIDPFTGDLVDGDAVTLTGSCSVPGSIIALTIPSNVDLSSGSSPVACSCPASGSFDLSSAECGSITLTANTSGGSLAVGATITDSDGDTGSDSKNLEATVRDADGDGVPDAVDVDDDNDGILDTAEAENCIFSTKINASSGTLPDGTTFVTSTTGGSTNILANGDFDLNVSGSNNPEVTVEFSDIVDVSISNTASSVSHGQVWNSASGGNQSSAATTNGGTWTFIQGTVAPPRPGIAINGQIASGLQSNLFVNSNQDWGSITTTDATVVSFRENNFGGVSFTASRSTARSSCIDDKDGDIVANGKDLDSDNDGISDLTESGFVFVDADSNSDGSITKAESLAWLQANIDPTIANGDANNDGLIDIYDASVNTNLTGGTFGTDPIDTNLDDTKNFLDLDSDGDTIPDATEARATADYVAYPATIDDAADSDDDGVLDIYDDLAGFGSTDSSFIAGTNTANADGDDTTDTVPDYLDLDSDDDGINDQAEAGPIATAPSYTDPDGSVNDPLGSSDGLENDGTELTFRKFTCAATPSATLANQIIYTFSGSDQIFDPSTLPSKLCWIKIKAWGAGGGGDPTSGSTRSRGGAGGYAELNYDQTNFPGTGTLTIVVGEGGKANGNVGTYGGGGMGGPRSGSESGGAGGGLSGVFFKSFATVSSDSDILIIAGAGGGGGSRNSFSDIAGVGGGLVGGDALSAGGGKGGTQTAGGLSAGRDSNPPTTVSGFLFGAPGATNTFGGGGGGSGYYGGGSGGFLGGDEKNGGGGSGFITPSSAVFSSSFQSGLGQAPGNSTDPLVLGGLGRGGNPLQNGGNGLVVVEWE